LAIVDAGHVVVSESAHAKCDDALEGGEFGEPCHAVELVRRPEELSAESAVESGEGFAEGAVFGFFEDDRTRVGLRAHFEVR